MKVIIIKECKSGKINDIVDVADGYAKNFLIKQGFALPINNSTKRLLDKKLEKIKENEAKELAVANEMKVLIEKTTLEFSLKSINNKVHGSITNKQVIKQLKENEISISKYALPHVHIASIGITKIVVDLHKDVKATLKIQVKNNG
ncbi:50S ribosomal protein L9 [Mycoplasma marinum]|uniref:Large ribosomal subunit protein bL9 n=1 Tax=Mycoplasma marinum TaxID=1937190 RepID=A0A4R0XRC4_9MOLU|nr:50S ribosomal protein L9 [Mycoplasma marinum]TCG10950.1 50S ribosomal protein L9 [Mycoplasma marinum]